MNFNSDNYSSNLEVCHVIFLKFGLYNITYLIHKHIYYSYFLVCLCIFTVSVLWMVSIILSKY